MKLASLAILFVASASADKYGGGGDGYGKVEASGTACIVKVLFSLVFFGEIIHFVFLSIQGSYCNCHYCKCEKGSVHCDKHGYGETTFNFQNIFVNKINIICIPRQEVLLWQFRGPVLPLRLLQVLQGIRLLRVRKVPLRTGQSEDHKILEEWKEK